MAIQSKLDPQKEYVFSEDRPYHIGVKVVGHRATAWFKRSDLRRTINKLSNQVNFWQEVMNKLNAQQAGAVYLSDNAPTNP